MHDPDQLVFWRIQADSLFMLKRFEEAVKAYDKTIALSPQEQEAAIYQKGLCLESLRRFEEAIVCYDQALSLDTKDKNVWISKGIALEWLERYEEALACYDQALSLDKEGRFVHARRGQVLAKLSRHEEAVAVVRQGAGDWAQGHRGADRQEEQPEVHGSLRGHGQGLRPNSQDRAEEQGRLGGPGHGPVPSRVTTRRPCVRMTGRWRSSRGT